MTHRTADPIEALTCGACGSTWLDRRAWAAHVGWRHPEQSVPLRLDAYTDRTAGPDACWPWLGTRTWQGHARLSVAGRNVLVGRIVLGLGRRSPLLALHRCDNPPCVNPRHLYAGTHRDNARDRWRGHLWQVAA